MFQRIEWSRYTVQQREAGCDCHRLLAFLNCVPIELKLGATERILEKPRPDGYFLDDLAAGCVAPEYLFLRLCSNKRIERSVHAHLLWKSQVYLSASAGWCQGVSYRVCLAAVDSPCCWVLCTFYKGKVEWLIQFDVGYDRCVRCRIQYVVFRAS